MGRAGCVWMGYDGRALFERMFTFQGSLSLQNLVFYVQASMRTMEILASVANSINKVTEVIDKNTPLSFVRCCCLSVCFDSPAIYFVETVFRENVLAVQC